MTVAQLIKKLQQMPKDAIITVYNDSTYFDGEYKATDVKAYDGTTVEISTDYKKRISE